jgi:hypothetical protein
MSGAVRPPDDRMTQLQARVDALEATLAQRDAEMARHEGELSRRMERLESGSGRPEARLTEREANRLFRAVTVASLVPIRAVANVVVSFTDALIRGIQQGDAIIGQVDPRRERAAGSTIVGHAYAGLTDAVNESLQIPKQTVDQFYETYNREPPA